MRSSSFRKVVKERALLTTVSEFKYSKCNGMILGRPAHVRNRVCLVVEEIWDFGQGRAFQALRVPHLALRGLILAFVTLESSI